jgi:pimeloyl-ACP methyl ester carboxylesterase
VRLRRSEGNPRATVLCVHGALDGQASFLRLARRLGDCDVVTYDRRGYRASRSVALRDGIAVQVDDVREVLDVARSLHAATPTVVLGHSFGGLVALALVAGPGAATTSVDAVVAYEPPFPWADPTTRHAPPESDRTAASAAEAFFRRIVGDASWERLSDEAKDERRHDGPALLGDLGVLNGEMPFSPSDLAVPVYIGVSNDAPPRRRASAEGLAHSSRAVTLVEFEQAGHGAHLTSPDRLAALVRQAIDGLATA